MYISVDMGGTNTRVAGSDSLERLEFVGNPIRRRNTMDYEDDLNFIINSAKKVAGRKAIAAVGIGTPGTPSPDRMYIASAVNIPHWNNQPLVEPISDALDCPVYYDNDAVTAGIGEACYGDYKCGDFHYLIWGTGIGGASIERNHLGNVEYVSKLIWKPRFKEWEQACAGGQLSKRYGKSPESFSDVEWQDVFRVFSGHLLRYVEQFEPPAIVFGGGLADKHRLFIEANSEPTGIDISVSNFGNDSGIIGSFGLIKYEQDPNHRPYVYQEDPED